MGELAGWHCGMKLPLVTMLLLLASRGTEGSCTATISQYPSYATAFPVYPDITGTVQVTTAGDLHAPGYGTTLQLSYELADTEPNCVNCGLHVHVGVTCEEAAYVGLHYYAFAEDPWNSADGAVYNSNSAGTAEGQFSIAVGLPEDQMYHRAVIIHGSGGAADRIGCGICYEDNIDREAGPPLATGDWIAISCSTFVAGVLIGGASLYLLYGTSLCSKSSDEPKPEEKPELSHSTNADQL